MATTDLNHQSREGLCASEQSGDSKHLGQFIPLHYHFQMLQDRDRLVGFRRAIEMHVKPGMHVVELGSGTGILSSFAAHCGASVTCVERNPELVQFSRNAIRKNGLADQIEVVEEDAHEYIPNRPVDAVICEMLHVGLIREKQTSVITSFKENYLNHWDEALPRFIPEASRLMVQLIDHPFEFEGFHACLPVFQSPNSLVNDGLRELSSLVDYQHVFYDEHIGDSVSWRGDIPVQLDGFVSALRFVTQNFLSVETGGESPIWSNQFLILPVPDPSSVQAGQTIQLELKYGYGESLEHLARSMQLVYSKLS